jgi:hypothetical protein
MTRRRRLRRRLLWAGVFLGVVLLYATVSALRACLWCRDVVVGARKQPSRRPHTRQRHVGAREGGSMYGRYSLAALVAAISMALAAPAAWADPWAADRHAQAQEAQQAASSGREPVGDDHFRDPPDPIPVAAVTRGGTKATWPELGLGVGLVVVLGLGALLTARQTRTRPLPR